MLRNLMAEIAREGLTQKQICEALGISNRAFANKMKGDSQFKWKEMQTIRSVFFDNLTLEYLFDDSKEA